MHNYDVAVIGAGICGCAAAYELSKYDLRVCVIEKENDVCTGTTKANSGIIHAGFDAAENTLMAKYNVAGAALMPQLAQRMSVEYKQIGSLVVAFDAEQEKTVEKLYKRGIANGVPQLEILRGEALRAKEPNLSEKAVCALWAPTAGVISPWDLGLALAETAVRNGVTLYLSSPVTEMKYDGDWKITAADNEINARCVINAAGLYADKIAALAGAEKFEIRPVKGQYYLLDRSQGEVFNTVVFQCPTAAGKGVLVSPTVTGNLIVGPDAVDVNDCADTSTDAAALQFIRQAAAIDTDKVNYRENIRNFAGVRAYSDRPDFIIGPDGKAEKFINIAGMKSPGLTSAAAIARDIPAMVAGLGVSAPLKASYTDSREIIRFCRLSHAERAQLVKKEPAYGRVICRCNTVTEGEILAALHSPIPPTTLDGVKRRCGTGMGRCQGGFCSPIIHGLISRELDIPYEKVYLEKTGSYIVYGRTKEAAK